MGLIAYPTLVEPNLDLPDQARWWAIAYVAAWIVLAGVPTALLVGVTSHLSTDVAAVPLLWIVPLAMYLVTLILAFARSRPIALADR